MTTEELKKLIETVLPDNSELSLYKKNREKGGQYLPHYHFYSPGGYLNDPNGYCRYKGLFHLFYQFESPFYNSLCWGHAISADNLHWIDLPCAVVPSIEWCCGSGGVLIEENRAVLCYQGDMKNTPGGAIHVFESTDDLLINWNRIGDGPVITTYNKNGDKNPYNAFDPYMWKEDGKYFLLSAGGGSLPHPDGLNCPDFRKMYLFCSDNLLNWTYLHSFVENDRFCEIGDDGACPYFLPIGENKYIILHYSHMSGGKYILGEYDKAKKKFFAESGNSFNSISWFSGVHAPSAYSDGNGCVDCIFNVNYGFIGDGINQIMSLTRKLSIDKNGLINQDTADNLSKLCKHNIADSVEIQANLETELNNICGQIFELDFTVDTFSDNKHIGFIPDNLLPMFELRVLKSKDNEEYSSIRIYRNRGKMNWEFFKNESNGHWANAAQAVIEVDTSMSSLSPDVSIHPTETRFIDLHVGEPIHIKLFVDKSILEVFINGKEVISVRVYPTREDSTGISAISRGVAAKLEYIFSDLSEI